MNRLLATASQVGIVLSLLPGLGCLVSEDRSSRSSQPSSGTGGTGGIPPGVADMRVPPKSLATTSIAPSATVDAGDALTGADASTESGAAPSPPAHEVVSSFFGRAGLDSQPVRDPLVAMLVRARIAHGSTVGGELIVGAAVDGDNVFDIGSQVPNVAIVATVLTGGQTFEPAIKRALQRGVWVQSALHVMTWRLSAADSSDTVMFEVDEYIVVRATAYEAHGDLLFGQGEVSIVGNPSGGWQPIADRSIAVAPTATVVSSGAVDSSAPEETRLYHAAYSQIVATDGPIAGEEASALTSPSGVALDLEGLLLIDPEDGVNGPTQQALSLPGVVRPLKKIARKIKSVIAMRAAAAAGAVQDFISVAGRYLAPVVRSAAKISHLVAGRRCDELAGDECRVCCAGVSSRISKGAQSAVPVCATLTGHPEACVVGEWVAIGIGVLLASACMSEC